MTGGDNGGAGGVPSAELFDPAARDGAGDVQPTGSMNEARGGQTATLMPSGKVLVAGSGPQFPGENTPGPLATAEIFDPATRVWKYTSPLSKPRAGHTVSLLPGGRLLAAGGYSNNIFQDFVDPAELYVSLAPPVPAVDDLTALPLSQTAIKLTFTAPAVSVDDDSPARDYVIKQSLAEFSAGGFDSPDSVSLCGGICHFDPGSSHSLTVNDLVPATTYHYALRPVGPEGEFGAISNVVSATTSPLSPPRVPCPPLPDPTAGEVAYKGGRYHLVGAPDGTRINSDSPLYSWFDLGASGRYSVVSASQPLTAGRGYWAFSFCDRLIDLPGEAEASVSFGLEGYHASMVGNPLERSPAEMSGHDFAALWDPEANGGGGGYRLSAYREPQRLAVGQGSWAFSYVSSTITIARAP